jgi:two-component system, NarL family, response regulator NreC
MFETPAARVVVADPHPSMLLTTRGLLEAEDGIEVLATTGDLSWATRIAAGHEADVLIIDLHMLEGSSRATIADLRRRLPKTAIVIHTMEAASAFARAAIGAGASGYVLKEFAESDLADAVRQAVIGQRFVSDKITA